MVLKMSLKSATTGGIPFLHGENSLEPYYRASEIRNKASRSLIKMLRKAELEGGCVDVLTEGNIRVYPSGNVNQMHVRILARQDLDDTAVKVRLGHNYQGSSGLDFGIVYGQRVTLSTIRY